MSVLGGWAVERVPEQRAAPGTERYGDLASLVIFFLAALCAVVVVFVSSARDGNVGSASHTPANTQTLAEARPVATTAPAIVATSDSAPALDQTSGPNAAAAQPNAVTERTVAPPERTQTQQRASATPADSISGVAAGAMPGATTSAVIPLDRVSESAASAPAIAASDRQGAEHRIREYVGLAPNQAIPPSFLYTIEPGDTLASIARRFGLEEATIHFNNFDLYDPNQLVLGETLRLPTLDGVIYTVQSGDNLAAVAQNYLADIDATVAFPGNELPSANQIHVGQTVLLVGGSASLPVASTGSSGVGSTAVAAAWTMPSFRWPLGFDEISDPFGTPRNNRQGFHTGVDFSAAIGTIVGATAAGQVSFAGWDNSYGYWVEIDHGGGVRSRYAHLSEIWVTTGAWVSAGSFVGTVGNTGNSSGAHLHFEIVMQGAPVDPLALLE